MSAILELSIIISSSPEKWEIINSITNKLAFLQQIEISIDKTITFMIPGIKLTYITLSKMSSMQKNNNNLNVLGLYLVTREDLEQNFGKMKQLIQEFVHNLNTFEVS